MTSSLELAGLKEAIELRDPGDKGPAYENGNAYAITYNGENIPEDSEILSDTSRMLELLKIHPPFPRSRRVMPLMRFIDFDEGLMWKVFQQFVTNFYRKKQTLYRVNPDAFAWLVSQSPEVEHFSLPGLATDIVLTSDASRVVIDTKFYPEPFEKRYGKLSVRSAHLNQMFAYMQNIAARDQQRRKVDGVLLYAAVSGEFSQDWALFGHKLRVARVDLSRDWVQIEKAFFRLLASTRDLTQI